MENTRRLMIAMRRLITVKSRNLEMKPMMRQQLMRTLGHLKRMMMSQQLMGHLLRMTMQYPVKV
jgi:hypothetical protein